MANTRKTLAHLLGAVALYGAASATQASDLTLFKTVFDTDFTAAGAGGMRGNGMGTINLTGVTGPVTEAYLYWHGPTNAAATDTGANANVTFNGNSISGEFLGISSDNCWGFANSMAYRADVSSLITGDGPYSLSDFLNSTTGADINGVSLIAFFDDGNADNNRDVVMFDGNDSNIANAFDANGWNIDLEGIEYEDGSANMQLHVSDGQTFEDGSVQVNGETIAAGSIFEGDEDARITNGASAGATSGGLWDIGDYDVTSLLSPGSNDLILSSTAGADCLSCILVAVDLPAGAAPDQPDDPDDPVDPGTPVPTPGTLVLFALGLFGLRRALTA